MTVVALYSPVYIKQENSFHMPHRILSISRLHIPIFIDLKIICTPT
jgi:hypothetical protein